MSQLFKPFFTFSYWQCRAFQLLTVAILTVAAFGVVPESYGGASLAQEHPLGGLVVLKKLTKGQRRRNRRAKKAFQQYQRNSRLLGREYINISTNNLIAHLIFIYFISLLIDKKLLIFSLLPLIRWSCQFLTLYYPKWTSSPEWRLLLVFINWIYTAYLLIILSVLFFEVTQIFIQTRLSDSFLPLCACTQIGALERVAKEQQMPITDQVPLEKMSEIGRRITKEQEITASEINWLIGICQAILRAFDRKQGQPMRQVAAQMAVSPTTLYKHVRWAVEVLLWVKRTKNSLQNLIKQVDFLKQELSRLESDQLASKRQIDSLTGKLFALNGRVSTQEAEIESLRSQWQLNQDRLIVVLKMSGRCTIRSIVEVLHYGLGVNVSVGYVQGVITKAASSADSKQQKLLSKIKLSGAICVDEIYLKEQGKKIWGIVVVDPMSGVVLHLERKAERSKDAIAQVLANFKNTRPGIEQEIKLCLTDMYPGYLEPVKALLPQASHQYCWFHINCFHIGATVKRAERAHEYAKKNLKIFDKKKHDGLSMEEITSKRLALVATIEQAKRDWVGSQRFQKMLNRIVGERNSKRAKVRMERLIRIASRSRNPYVKKMGLFLGKHEARLLMYYTCLDSKNHQISRLSKSQQKWVPVTKRWAIPITTNAAEHVFRGLRRYTKNMEQFRKPEATERFFDLFALYHNCRTLREGKKAGNSLLAAAHLNVIELFGTDDPYTILGFPQTKESFNLSQNTHQKSKILSFPSPKPLPSVHSIAA